MPGNAPEGQPCPRELLAGGALPKLHVASQVNKGSPLLSALLASAEHYHVPVRLLGFGSSMSWSKEGFQMRLDMYRDHILSFPASAACDIILFLDAYDSILLKEPEVIVEAFLRLENRTGRHLVFGLEDPVRDCDSSLCRRQQDLARRHAVTTPWTHVNGGLLAGRVHALAQVFERPADVIGCADCVGDQEWMQHLVLDHPDLAVLDYRCELFQNVKGLESLPGKDFPAFGLALVETAPGRLELVNRLTGTHPPVAHFPGQGHWGRDAPCAKDAGRLCTSTAHLEVFRVLYPSAYRGSGLELAHDFQDSLDMPDFLRPSRPYVAMNDVDLVKELHDRDVTIGVCQLVGLALLPTVACAALLWRCLRKRGGCVQCISSFKTVAAVEEGIGLGPGRAGKRN